MTTQAQALRMAREIIQRGDNPTWAERHSAIDAIDVVLAAQQPAATGALQVARDALWVCAEHNQLHHGKSHNTTIQARAAIAAIDADPKPSAEPAEIMGLPFKEAKARIPSLNADDARGMAISLMIQNSALLKWEKAFLSQPIDAPQQTVSQAGPVGAPAEPVAWANSASLTSARISRERGGPFDRFTLSEGRTSHHDAPLYATPPAAPVPTAQPLTDQRIEDGASEAGYNVYKLTAFVEGARFAEAQHGIGASTATPIGSAA